MNTFFIFSPSIWKITKPLIFLFAKTKYFSLFSQEIGVSEPFSSRRALLSWFLKLFISWLCFLEISKAKKLPEMENARKLVINFRFVWKGKRTSNTVKNPLCCFFSILHKFKKKFEINKLIFFMIIDYFLKEILVFII